MSLRHRQVSRSFALWSNNQRLTAAVLGCVLAAGCSSGGAGSSPSASSTATTASASGAASTSNSSPTALSATSGPTLATGAASSGNSAQPSASASSTPASASSLSMNADASPTQTAGSAEMDAATPESSSAAPVASGSTPVVPNAGPASSRLRAVPVGESDAELGYWEYLPPDYESGPKPLLVFTHGASWQGNGSLEALQELLEVGPPNLIDSDAWPNDRPFIVLAPQNPHSGCFTADDIDGFYRYAVEHYDVDASRIYHTGQSCGAIGAWNYLAAHLDEYVSAAVLISGDGKAAFQQAGCDLGKVAIWGLHNELDGSVDSSGTVEPITALMECTPAPDVKLTIYPGETAHDAWTKTYDLSAGNDIYSWLLTHTHQ